MLHKHAQNKYPMEKSGNFGQNFTTVKFFRMKKSYPELCEARSCDLYKSCHPEG